VASAADLADEFGAAWQIGAILGFVSGRRGGSGSFGQDAGPPEVGIWAIGIAFS